VIADRVTRAPHTPASRRAPQRTYRGATSTTPTSTEASMTAFDELPEPDPRDIPAELSEDDLGVLHFCAQQLRSNPDLADAELEFAVQHHFDWSEDDDLCSWVPRLARAYVTVSAFERQHEERRLRDDPAAAYKAISEHVQMLDDAIVAKSTRSREAAKAFLKILRIGI